MGSIGSLISLVTNSEIRYEGFMCYLDAKDTTIGLQYVRSFGTEGRRKDGSQLPPSETIYEYLYFHRCDIEDMVVRSSISVQTTRLPDDPAIIQGYLPLLSYAPANLSTSGAAQVTYTGYDPQSGLLVPSTERSYSFQQTVENPGSWGCSFSHLPLNISRPAMPTALPWFPGSSGEVSQFNYQHFPPPPRGLMESRPTQQHTHSSSMNAHLVTISPSIVEPHNRLIRHITTLSQNRLPPVPPLLFGSLSGLTSVPSLSSTDSQILFPSVHSLSATPILGQSPKPSLFKPPNLQPTITSQSITMDLNSQVSSPPGTFNSYTATKQVTETKTSVPDLSLEYSKLVLPVIPTLGTDNFSLVKIPVQSSVTLLKQGRKELPSTQSLLIANDDPKLNHKSASEALLSESGNVKEPPSQYVQPQAREKHGEYDLHPNNSYARGRTIKPSEAPIQADNGNRSHAKAREHGVERFTDDFDFEAMNKKFNKEEVWRSLGERNITAEVATVGVPKLVKNHVYSEDGFFDTLFGNSPDHRSEKGGEDLAEQKRIDNETFGDVHNDQETRGNQEPVRSGGSRGSSSGNGHVKAGRGRGRTILRRVNWMSFNPPIISDTSDTLSTKHILLVC